MSALAAPRDLPEVLTSDETAALLRIHKNTLCSLAAAGEIPCRRVGREYRFSRSAVLDWLVGAESRVAPSRRRR